jgi:hypothetical protein
MDIYIFYFLHKGYAFYVWISEKGVPTLFLFSNGVIWLAHHQYFWNVGGTPR